MRCARLRAQLLMRRGMQVYRIIIGALSAGVFYEIAAGHFCRLGKAHEVKESRGDVSEYAVFPERYAAA